MNISPMMSLQPHAIARGGLSLGSPAMVYDKKLPLFAGPKSRGHVSWETHYMPNLRYRPTPLHLPAIHFNSRSSCLPALAGYLTH